MAPEPKFRTCKLRAVSFPSFEFFTFSARADLSKDQQGSYGSSRSGYSLTLLPSCRAMPRCDVCRRSSNAISIPSEDIAPSPTFSSFKTCLSAKERLANTTMERAPLRPPPSNETSERPFCFCSRINSARTPSLVACANMASASPQNVTTLIGSNQSEDRPLSISRHLQTRYRFLWYLACFRRTASFCREQS